MSQVKAIEIVDIPVDQISPSPFQPRIDFELEDLRGSIIKYGIVDPLKVRKVGDQWELIDGERRWRIAQQEGIEKVPCIVSEYSDDEADALAWRLNTERKQYSLEERAKHFKSHQDDGLSGAAIGRIHGYGQQHVNRLLSIFRLPEKYITYLWTGEFAVAKYQYLYGKGLINDDTFSMATDIISIIDEAIERRLTQREFENVVDDYLSDLEKRQVDAARKAAVQLEASTRREERTKEALGEPEVKPPETSEEFEQAAKVLRKRAKELKTPKQRAAEEAEKERKKIEADEKKRRDAEENARSSLLTGKNNAQSKIQKVIEEGLDATEFNARLKDIEAMITEEPSEAFKEAKKLKDDIDTVIRDEKIKREAVEAERKKLEAEAESRLEEERERLQKDPEFRRSVVIERAEKEEIMKELVKDRDIISEGQRIGRELAEAQIDLEELEERRKERKGRTLFWLKLGIKSIIRKQKRGELFCPEHKGSELIWDCGCKLEDTLKQIEGKED